MQPLFVEVANSDSEPKILNTPPTQAIADSIWRPRPARASSLNARPGPYTGYPRRPRNYLCMNDLQARAKPWSAQGSAVRLTRRSCIWYTCFELITVISQVHWNTTTYDTPSGSTTH